MPSDTQTREILDPLAPEHLRPAFGDVFRQLQRGKALEPFEFYNGGYLLSLFGTGYFSSQQIHCPSCQVKEHKNGTVTCEHQMLAAVSWVWDVPLNESNPDLRVNFLEYRE